MGSTEISAGLSDISGILTQRPSAVKSLSAGTDPQADAETPTHHPRRDAVLVIVA